MKKNLRVAINASYTHSKPTGIGVYTRELVSALLETDSDFDFTAYSNSKHLKRRFPGTVKRAANLISPDYGTKGHLARLVWEQTVLPLRARMDGASVLHSTAPEGPLRPGMEQTITVHDIFAVKYPEMWPKWTRYFQYVLPKIIKNSSAIVCDSENTRADVLDYYQLKDKPVYVVYAGYDREVFYPKEKGLAREKFGLGDYILYVGDMRPHKNIVRGLEAFSALDMKGVKFVVAGRKDPRFLPPIEKKAEELSIREEVVLLDFVSDEDLSRLYSDALLLFFPSIYEGFGLPPLEAMACGCPVVSSAAGSLAEVIGDATYIINHFDTESMAEGLGRTITDSTLREELVEKGLKQAGLFSWKRAAKELTDIFSDITGE